MSKNETVTLSRDCQAVLVPAGTHVMIPEGTEVTITQDLGGSYTISIYGNLARIAPQDADALGKDIQRKQIALKEGETLSKEFILEQLKTCYDPEIPVNIVDLGLIYHCELEPLEEENEFHVKITMTLTAPGCGIGPHLMSDIEHITRSIPGVKDVKIDLVFDPPWNQDMMSDEAKLQLGLI